LAIFGEILEEAGGLQDRSGTTDHILKAAAEALTEKHPLAASDENANFFLGRDKLPPTLPTLADETRGAPS